MPPRTRPQGQPTRGKTAVNRLRRIDVFVALAMPSVLRGGSPLAVDLGFGARPWTAIELAERWGRVNPGLRVLGIEIDPERVAQAMPYADPPRLDFALGGFDLATVLGTERARIVRCMNVLRQYDEHEVERALALIAQGLEPGGVLVEGTSNPAGRIAVFDIYRRGSERAASRMSESANATTALEHEALVFATNFRAAHEPGEFRTIAPKRLIHRMRDETPERFFAEWDRAAATARAVAEPGTARHWAETARLLREAGWPVDPRARLLERGFLVLRDDLR